MDTRERWERRLFRGNKVWVRVDGTGAPRVDERGNVAVRYKQDDEREYAARPAHVLAITPEALARIERDRVRARKRTATLEVFTAADAGSRHGPAGAGLVFEGDGHRREVALFLGEATRNVAEVRAVEVALGRIKDRSRSVRLHVDSAYVVGVLTGAWPAAANRALIERVRRLIARFPSLRWVKVKADTDDERARLAARLAGRARSEARSSDVLRPA